jgi:malate dehydrogenase (oxaloacetate-decarboxylating)
VAASDDADALLPPVGVMREAAVEVAVAVGLAAVSEGVAPAASEAELRAAVARCRWTPAY